MMGNNFTRLRRNLGTKKPESRAVGPPLSNNYPLGFTFIELLITLGTLAILVMIALPSYLNNLSRSHYAEVITLIDPYREATDECITNLNTLVGCSSGTNNIPTFTGPVGQLRTLIVRNGVITARPVASNGIKTTDTYILRPTLLGNGQVTWSNAGSGCLTTKVCKPYP